MKTKLMNKFEIKSEIKLNYGIKYNVKNLYYNCKETELCHDLTIS
jgi:hypothetical protein